MDGFCRVWIGSNQFGQCYYYFFGIQIYTSFETDLSIFVYLMRYRTNVHFGWRRGKGKEVGVIIWTWLDHLQVRQFQFQIQMFLKLIKKLYSTFLDFGALRERFVRWKLNIYFLCAPIDNMFLLTNKYWQFFIAIKW